ncbi:MAG: glycosyltransferase family 2 protein [Cyclobacteriaceae bacterium]
MAANKPLVSVLMTVYNRQDYIAEAIQSVLNSSFTDWELVIVDDGSADQSYEIARKIAAKNAKIRLSRNGSNLGQFANRDKAASLAKGKYIKYLDSDDLIYPHGLQVMVDAMEKFPEAAFGMPGLPNGDEPYPIKHDGHEGVRKHFLDGNYFAFGPSALIFKKESFDAIGGFGDNPYVGSDTEIMIRLANKYDYVTMSPSLIWWRSHDQQEIKQGHSSNQYYLEGYHRTRAMIEECSNALGAQKSIALKKLRNLYISQSLRLIKAGHYKPVLELLKK